MSNYETRLKPHSIKGSESPSKPGWIPARFKAEPEPPAGEGGRRRDGPREAVWGALGKPPCGAKEGQLKNNETHPMATDRSTCLVHHFPHPSPSWLWEESGEEEGSPDSCSAGTPRVSARPLSWEGTAGLGSRHGDHQLAAGREPENLSSNAGLATPLIDASGQGQDT